MVVAWKGKERKGRGGANSFSRGQACFPAGGDHYILGLEVVRNRVKRGTHSKRRVFEPDDAWGNPELASGLPDLASGWPDLVSGFRDLVIIRIA